MQPPPPPPPPCSPCADATVQVNGGAGVLFSASEGESAAAKRRSLCLPAAMPAWPHPSGGWVSARLRLHLFPLAASCAHHLNPRPAPGWVQVRATACRLAALCWERTPRPSPSSRSCPRAWRCTAGSRPALACATAPIAPTASSTSATSECTGEEGRGGEGSAGCAPLRATAQQLLPWVYSVLQPSFCCAGNMNGGSFNGNLNYGRCEGGQLFWAAAPPGAAPAAAWRAFLAVFLRPHPPPSLSPSPSSVRCSENGNFNGRPLP